MNYRPRDLLADIVWTAFQLAVDWSRGVARHWRRLVAATTMAIAITRGAIWLAKAIASAGSVDTALNLVGLGAIAAPFEAAVDNFGHMLLSFAMSLIGG